MMYAVFTVIFLIIPGAYACKQKMYDQIYRAIIKDSLAKDLQDPTIFVDRNKAITTLRELCDGQKSSYEKGTDDGVKRKRN